MKLQEIFLAQEIQKQLAERGITEHKLSDQFIEAAKQAESEEDFISLIEQKGISTSKHFLASLYNKIRQGLASAINVPEEGIDEELSDSSMNFNQ